MCIRQLFNVKEQLYRFWQNREMTESPDTELLRDQSNDGSDPSHTFAINMLFKETRADGQSVYQFPPQFSALRI